MHNVLALAPLILAKCIAYLFLSHQIPHVLYISELLSPPLLIAALGLRLSTRIKLASFAVKKEEREQVDRNILYYLELSDIVKREGVLLIY